MWGMRVPGGIRDMSRPVKPTPTLFQGLFTAAALHQELPLHGKHCPIIHNASLMWYSLQTDSRDVASRTLVVSCGVFGMMLSNVPWPCRPTRLRTYGSDGRVCPPSGEQHALSRSAAEQDVPARGRCAFALASCTRLGGLRCSPSTSALCEEEQGHQDTCVLACS